jgi:hypothetical protein
MNARLAKPIQHDLVYSGAALKGLPRRQADIRFPGPVQSRFSTRQSAASSRKSAPTPPFFAAHKRLFLARGASTDQGERDPARRMASWGDEVSL